MSGRLTPCFWGLTVEVPHVRTRGDAGLPLHGVWMGRHKSEEVVRVGGEGEMNTFKIEPGEWETLTKGGLKFHAILNGKRVSQRLAIMKDGRRNILVLVTESEGEEVDPLRERKHRESDPI